MLVKVSNNLKNALLQRALERLIQRRFKKEMRQYNYFKKMFIPICLCALCIHIGQVYVYTPQYILAVMVNHECYFPFVLFPHFNSIGQSKEFIEFFSIFSHCMKIVGVLLYSVGLSLVAIPFAIITINIWRIHILKFLTPNIKYTPQYTTLKTPLLRK